MKYKFNENFRLLLCWRTMNASDSRLFTLEFIQFKLRKFILIKKLNVGNFKKLITNVQNIDLI